MSTVSESRAAATRVAAVLRERGRAADAVKVLSAWAAAGPNDEEGQALLAEALRIEPNSAIARSAFERMEGIVGDHAELDAAIAHYTPEELNRLEREGRPVFRRAQVGFNNNMKYKGQPFHVQTEDSGLDKAHIITHLFADGGRIIKSVKRSYADAVQRPDIAMYVRTLMRGQHMEMVLALREGRWDPIIEGRAPGGMDVLDTPPQVDVGRVGGQRSESPSDVAPAKSRAAPADSAARAAAKNAPVRVTLHVVRSLSGGPERYDPPGDYLVIGSQGDVPLTGERFCHPREAALRWKEGTLWVEDFEGGNGVFLRIRRRVEIAVGDEFIVGDQLLRLERNPPPDDGPDPGPTYFRASPKTPSSFRVVQVFEGGALGGCAMARGTTLQIGSVVDDYFANDLVFPRDPLVSPYHCVVEEQAESFILSDLGARSGVFVRVVGRQQLAHGDEILVGRTRLLVDLSPAAAQAS